MLQESKSGFKPKNLRYGNYKSIINLFRYYHDLTLREISDKILLSKTSLSKIINLLLEKGFLIAKGKGISTSEGGKRPEIYSLNENFKYCISIYLLSDSCNAVLKNLNHKTLHSIQRSYFKYLDKHQIVCESVSIIQELLSVSGISSDSLCGIALSVPAIVNADQSVLLYSIHDPLVWEADFQISQEIQNALPFKSNIFVENLCRFIGYSEMLNNLKRRQTNIVTIYSADDHTGGCIFHDGHMVHGKNGLIGEFGHITTDYSSDAIQCHCGSSGCFETTISHSVLIKRAQNLCRSHPKSVLCDANQKGNLDFGHIFKASNEADSLAQELLDEVALHFAILICQIRFIADPDEIIIQGLYANSGEYFQQSLRNRLAQFSANQTFPLIKISFSSSTLLVEQQAHIGASLYLADRFFDIDEIYD